MYCIGCSAGHRQGADTDTSNNQAHRSWLDTSYTGQTVSATLLADMRSVAITFHTMLVPHWCHMKHRIKTCWECMLSAQPDNSKCRYTDTRLQEERRRLCGSALWAKHLKGWCFFWNWPLSGLQGVEVCAGLLQSVPRSAAECVQGYRVCAECSFNILPFSSRLNQKIFYWKKNILFECVLKTKIIWKIDYFEDSI